MAVYTLIKIYNFPALVWVFDHHHSLTSSRSTSLHWRHEDTLHVTVLTSWLHTPRHCTNVMRTRSTTLHAMTSWGYAPRHGTDVMITHSTSLHWRHEDMLHVTALTSWWHTPRHCTDVMRTRSTTVHWRHEDTLHVIALTSWWHAPRHCTDVMRTRSTSLHWRHEDMDNVHSYTFCSSFAYFRYSVGERSPLSSDSP